MPTGMLKGLIVVLALAGGFGGGTATVWAPARVHRHVQVDEGGCRERPAAVPATPPPPAACS